MGPRVALITGAASGIGLGIATHLADEGWSLALNGTRSPERAAPALEQLRARATKVIYLQGDVGRSETRSALVAGTIDAFGRIDALVNNAGITSPDRRDFLDATEDSFDRVIEINTKAPYFLAQIAAKEMIKQRASEPDFHGCIINVTSVSASVVSVNRGDYCISKAGLSMANKVMAARLGEAGIDCFEIRPGLILTDMTAGAKDRYDRLIADGITIDRRWGTPTDVGRVVATLLRGDLPYSTGQVLNIDGGMTIQAL